MKYIPIVLLAIAFGVCCGWFQFWMTTRLAKKRWLLLLQPGLFAMIALCFEAWVFSLDELHDSSARFIPLVFVVLLVCTATGWAVGEIRRRRKE